MLRWPPDVSAGGYPLPVDRLTDLRTDMYENITFSETTLAGGNKAILEPMHGVGGGGDAKNWRYLGMYLI